MGFADQYLSKQKGVSPFFTDQPSQQLRFTVVIPAYCEPGLSHALEALWNCTRPHGHVEVIVVVNSSEHAPPSVRESSLLSLQTAATWIREYPDPAFHYLLMDKTAMPARDAGVGLARKNGMDEALFRFNQIGNPNGFILSFDADSLCDSNYFTAIEAAIDRNPSANGFNVYFEHPVYGNNFPEKVYRGITGYELHLRYMNLFLRFTGFPFAYHTIGSCFGVRADAYAAQGGMNKRKAGEDFYFLHKIIPLGNFIDINDTRIIPSPRISDRVPFGTGMAMGKYFSSGAEVITTYAPECFLTLLSFFQITDKLFKKSYSEVTMIIQQLPEPIRSYLLDQDAVHAITEINNNCNSFAAFINRFFRWFDAFWIVKYLNSAHRSYFKQIPVNEAAIRLLEIAGYRHQDDSVTSVDLLKIFRSIERGEDNR